jgi:hypothetical protein
MTRIRRTKDPWRQQVNAYSFAMALGYSDYMHFPPDMGEQACYMQGDGLLCRFYPDHLDLELFAKDENDETTEYGSNVFRFDLPAPVEQWFQQLCEVDHLWTDDEKDRAEFLEMYRDAETERRVKTLKQIFSIFRSSALAVDTRGQGFLDFGSATSPLPGEAYTDMDDIPGHRE